MSKASIDTSLTEALIYEAPDLKVAAKVRSDLVNNFSNCWFFVYTQTSKIFATNEWGGKLSPEILQELHDRAEELGAAPQDFIPEFVKTESLLPVIGLS